MAVVGLFIIALLVGVLVATSGRVTDRDIAWLSSTASTSPAEAAVYRRYLARHRRHRMAGGVGGSLYAIVIGVRYGGSVNLGIGQGNPLADVLFCGLAGVLVGALVAEKFRLNSPTNSRVVASLAERDIRVDPRIAHVARALTAGSVVAGAVVGVTGNGVDALAVALAGLAVAGIAEATRRAIADRRRPVLSEAASKVDASIRSFATRSVALLQLCAAVLVVGWVISKTPFDDTALELVQVVVALGCLAATVVLLHRAAPRPPRGWNAPRHA